MSDILKRIQSETKGSLPHSLIVDRLKEKRAERLERVSGIPESGLPRLQAEVCMLDEIINELTQETREPVKVKTGAYT